METFSLNPPRWLSTLFGRNALIRRSDRIEALALALAVVVVLLAIPVAGAAGTMIYDSRSLAHAERAQSLTTVTATVVDAPARSDLTRVHARWVAGGTEHTEVIRAASAPKPGESVEVVVNQDGTYAGPPRVSPAREAAFMALAIWLNVAVVAGLAFVGVRKLVDRSRNADWHPELVHVASKGSGQDSDHVSRS
ncbi:hypothetical protein A5634_25880 [Mycobacterium asiaticum]|uniref:Transmembrane protein n=1 Tax=Mycobacterium asiaticum TaxID=1790 RepID=A0A1A3NWQ1_MYCAS|nr:hypothetical protein A5634_25880 [Mycobacterium asiaticum]